MTPNIGEPTFKFSFNKDKVYFSTTNYSRKRISSIKAWRNLIKFFVSFNKKMTYQLKTPKKKKKNCSSHQFCCSLLQSPIPPINLSPLPQFKRTNKLGQHFRKSGIQSLYSNVFHYFESVRPAPWEIGKSWISLWWTLNIKSYMSWKSSSLPYIYVCMCF